jgi:hypothetical protein
MKKLHYFTISAAIILSLLGCSRTVATKADSLFTSNTDIRGDISLVSCGFRSAIESRQPPQIQFNLENLETALIGEGYSTVILKDALWSRSLTTGNLLIIKQNGVIFILAKSPIQKIQDIDAMNSDMLTVSDYIKNSSGANTSSPGERLWLLKYVYNDTSIVYLRTYWDDNKFNSIYNGTVVLPDSIIVKEANIVIRTWQQRAPNLSISFNGNELWNNHPWVENSIEHISIIDILFPGHPHSIIIEPSGSWFNYNQNYLAWIEVLGETKSLDRGISINSSNLNEKFLVLARPMADLKLEIPKSFIEKR